MNHKLNRKAKFMLAFLVSIALAGCFKILTVSQVSSATAGSKITSTVTVTVEGTSDATPHYGIVGLLVPNDWTIDSVYFSGPYSDYCTYLPPTVPDSERAGQVNYWTDSLESRYPSGTNMKWMVYQSYTSHLARTDTVNVTLTVKMTVGQTQGNYNLGYFVTDAALDFTDPSYYSVSLNNPISVTAVVPVELTSFTAQSSNNSVELKWSTATETNNKGFEVERSTDKVNFSRIGFIPGNGSTTEIHQYAFTDNTVSSGTYYYRLKQLDYDGSYKYSSVTEVKFSLPVQYSISQNYPNPFNPSTSINFALPAESNVVIDLYNVLGARVMTIASGDYPAGAHQVSLNAANLASGTYIYSISVSGKDGSKFVSSKKMILMK